MKPEVARIHRLLSDKKTVYIKGIGNKVTAADISEGKYKEIWSIEMPYKSDFVPTRIESSGKLIFIPTESGTVHAVKKRRKRNSLEPQGLAFRCHIAM